jgi:16S rRNA (guanine1516-N2)-methyltransferase
VCKTDALPLSYPPERQRAGGRIYRPPGGKSRLQSSGGRAGGPGYAAGVQGLITTAPSGSFGEAEELAARFGLTAALRGGRTIPQLVAAAGKAPVLVLGKARADLAYRGRSYRASVGMAFLRVVRAQKGEIDPLVKAAGLKRGDRVLDATLGLGGDALVAAHATGAPVLGLETSPALAAFVTAALRRVHAPGRVAAGLIQVCCADHRTVLKEMPAGSVDVVLFDPMFRSTGESGPLFELVRQLADRAPLTGETMREALRVARRGVLVKDAPPGFELARLGIKLLPTRRSPRIMFGWADAQ